MNIPPMNTPPMNTPPASRPAPGPRQRSAVLGSVTIPGRPRAVSGARAFVARTVAAAVQPDAVDLETATLLTSELVTNAIQHTASGAPDGTVTIVVIDVAGGVLIEVTDEGSAGVPTVQGDPLAPDGHGLYLVQQLAAQWGYRRDHAGTTVWFHLSAASDSAATAASTPAQIAATSSSPDT